MSTAEVQKHVDDNDVYYVASFFCYLNKAVFPVNHVRLSISIYSITAANNVLSIILAIMKAYK